MFKSDFMQLISKKKEKTKIRIAIITGQKTVIC